MLDIDKSCVMLNLKAKSKQEVLEELTAALCQRPMVDAGISQKELVQILMEREMVGSTGVGNGVAIPHGKITGLDRIVLCFGRSQAGLRYEAVDNQPVHLLVLILSPIGMSSDYLQALAKVSRLLKEEKNRELLLLAKDPEEVVELFRKEIRA